MSTGIQAVFFTTRQFSRLLTIYIKIIFISSKIYLYVPTEKY